ncbi:transcription factor [Ganoderma sinense ZZ0214-1]|uniref:Transcription factor n=1 Tax=Ganoderma sinense ZZ0214-1 TaxID=1077348 RepID=A0A2G8RSI8_9APHY|nr:transcription factor [Ganoderma sinense ZZ0214-1]
MSPVKCLECGLIWPSKNKAGGHKPGATAHKLAYACITCSVTFTKCKDLHSHEAAARHKPPQDLGPVMAAAQAAAERGSRAACTALASASGPSHAPAPSWEDDADADSDAGGYSCPVCYMEFETQDILTDHVSSTLPCAACMSCLDPFQTLEDHYWESDNHPKCRPCALGFENQAAWTAHQATCAIAPLRKSNVNNSPSKSAGAGRPWQVRVRACGIAIAGRGRLRPSSRRREYHIKMVRWGMLWEVEGVEGGGVLREVQICTQPEVQREEGACLQLAGQEDSGQVQHVGGYDSIDNIASMKKTSGRQSCGLD